jgi:hypothetical protein
MIAANTGIEQARKENGRSGMIMTADQIAVSKTAHRWIAMSMLAVCCGGIGCSHANKRPICEAVSPFQEGTTIAVAPALNFSGTSAFDSVKVADFMASELTTIRGIRVIGVTRVLAVLGEQGFGQIQSPEHALHVCDRLGADLILVFAVTEYDPYRPIVGIAAQLYGRDPAGSNAAASEASKNSRPFPVGEQANAPRPWGETQRVFNGVHKRVQRQVEEYAEGRGEDKSPYGWRKYLASQEWYLRFCCYNVATDLMGISPCPTVADADRKKEFGL